MKKLVKVKQVNKTTFVYTNKSLGLSILVNLPNGVKSSDHVKIATAKMGRDEKKFSHKTGRLIVVDKFLNRGYIVMPCSVYQIDSALENVSRVFDNMLHLLAGLE